MFLCQAILSNDPHILTDASIDPRSLANPLVAGDFGLRFYAGVPLTTDDGHNLGTLCIIDKEARPIDQAQIDDLKDLASIVMDQIEMQLSARRAVSQAQLMAKEIDHRVMNSLQFGLGAFAVGCMLLTHPERLQHYDDLWVDCAGDEFSPDADGAFGMAPYFYSSGGALKFDTYFVGHAHGHCGSASGFVSQS